MEHSSTQGASAGPGRVGGPGEAFQNGRNNAPELSRMPSSSVQRLYNAVLQPHNGPQAVSHSHSSVRGSFTSFYTTQPHPMTSLDEGTSFRTRMDSPLHRAGLLQPRSYTTASFLPDTASSNELPSSLRHFRDESGMHPHIPGLHKQDSIRANTMQLSEMQFSPSRSFSVTSPPPALTSTISRLTEGVKIHDQQPLEGGKSSDHHPRTNLEACSRRTLITSRGIGQSVHSFTTVITEPRTDQYQPPSSPISDSLGQAPPHDVERRSSATPLGQTPPPASNPLLQSVPSRSRSQSPGGPSGLSLLRREYEASEGGSGASSPLAQHSSSTSPTVPTKTFSPDPVCANLNMGLPPSPSPLALTPASETSSEASHARQDLISIPRSDERTHLLAGGTEPRIYTSIASVPPTGTGGSAQRPGKRAGHGLVSHFATKMGVPLHGGSIVLDVALASVQALPAVTLGLLLNILDGVSYGMILFPTALPFSSLGPSGVTLFFITCVLSQLVYTFGGSGFDGANGSMMIEVVPFFHILATSIAREVGEDREREVIATTLVAYALSSVMTGLTFLLLGALKLGNLIGFFPRHILVGCIGGVGVFLIITGLAVSLRLTEDASPLEILEMMFESSHSLTMWALPLFLAVILRVITARWRHQLIFPLYFLAVPMLFYIIVLASQTNLGSLRKAGWIFDVESAGDPWWTVYAYFDISLIHFAPLWKTLPTQFALLFFNILHPPLNVPALSVSLDEDVDTNRELVAHGYSNLLAGLLGTVPNYLVYVNTLLFYRVGGTSRLSGLLLAIFTFGLLILGTGPIAYIPVMVVGALIFVLGLDLVKEAVWDTRNRVTWYEYITIISIMVSMTLWDFVIGVLFGIVASCFFFVVQNSQRRSIRALHTGVTAMSTVRRPSIQRAYLREVSKQTTILRLQGFLFFGTITHVEESIRAIIEGPSWQSNPVRFLVLDLTLVAGIDMSAAEAFVRLQRISVSKYVTLIFCGFSADSSVGRALENVDILDMECVESFLTFNDAMEWTENAYLRAWFRSQKADPIATILALPGRQGADTEHQGIKISSLATSPRFSHLRDVGDRTIASELKKLSLTSTSEAHNALVRTFSSYGVLDPEEFQPLENYMHRVSLPSGHVLWKQLDQPDGLYIIESGVLRATYHFADHTRCVEESMVAGTLAGELSALSDLPRNATVVVEQPAIVWRLSIADLRRLEVERPALAHKFVGLILKTAKIDYDILLAALAS